MCVSECAYIFMLSRHATREGALDSFKWAENVRSTVNEAKADGPHSMSLPKTAVAEIFSVSTKNQWDYTLTRDIYTSRKLFMTKKDGKALEQIAWCFCTVSGIRRDCTCQRCQKSFRFSLQME